jgi:hypothetical protein
MLKAFKYSFIFCLLGLCPLINYAQQNTDTIRVEAFITPEGDTIGQSWLPTVLVGAIQTNHWRNYWKEWTRLRNAVYVTYPYAKSASKVISEVNAQLVNVSDESQRKQIIKLREKELKKEFADKITQLSMNSGRVKLYLRGTSAPSSASKCWYLYYYYIDKQMFSNEYHSFSFSLFKFMRTLPLYKDNREDLMFAT